MIHPDWCSEKIDRPKFEGRPYRPWSYEFQGARTYPSPGDRARSTRGHGGSSPHLLPGRQSPWTTPQECITVLPNPDPDQEKPLLARALQETSDNKVIYPKLWCTCTKTADAYRNKYNISQPADGTNISKASHPLPPDVSRGSSCPPPEGYRITTAPDGSIRRLRMTPAATSLYVNTLDAPIYQPDVSTWYVLYRLTGSGDER